ncbi:MAG: hypothetical protein Q8Q25_00145 [bacterium]|nr:hypothetical protein [bacterium]
MKKNNVKVVILTALSLALVPVAYGQRGGRGGRMGGRTAVGGTSMRRGSATSRVSTSPTVSGAVSTSGTRIRTSPMRGRRITGAVSTSPTVSSAVSTSPTISGTTVSNGKFSTSSRLSRRTAGTTWRSGSRYPRRHTYWRSSYWWGGYPSWSYSYLSPFYNPFWYHWYPRSWYGPYWGSTGLWLASRYYYDYGLYDRVYPRIYNETGMRIKFYVDKHSGYGSYELTVVTEQGQTETFGPLTLRVVAVVMDQDGTLSVVPR